MTMTKSRFRVRLASFSAAAAIAVGGAPALASPLPLITAARDGQAGEVARLVHQRKNLNAQDEAGATALAWAVARNNAPVVKQLLAAGADPNLGDASGVGPLILAVAANQQDVVAMLLDGGANPNAPRDSGETPLMTAARVGSPDIARMLLSHGAKADVREERFGQTALMWATGHPAVVRLLLDGGADIKLMTKSWDITTTSYRPRETGAGGDYDGAYKVRAGGQNALMFAVLKNDVASVKMLLDAGSDVNQPSADGTTPLLASLYHWQVGPLRADPPYHLGQYSELVFAPDPEIANLLLDRGAKANVASLEGYTPLHAALLSVVMRDKQGAQRLAFNYSMRCEPNRARPKPPADDTEAVALVKRLLEAGADPNAATRLATPGPIRMVRINPAPPGSTPYHVAAATHDPRLVELLAEHGADANRVRMDGHTPLSIAVMNNDLPTVQVLWAHGADLTRRYDPADEISDDVGAKAQPRKDQTILHIAAIDGAEWVVPFLAAKGAPVDAKNSSGETPFDLANAQEIFRFQTDSQRPLGGPKPEKRETQTSDAFRQLLPANTRAANAARPQPPA